MKTIATLFGLMLAIGAGAQSYAELFKDTLDATLAAQAQQHGILGLGAAVVFPDGSTWEAAEGTYGANELTPNELFEIGSTTKSMTCAIILLEESEGLLSVHDSIGMYLQAYPNVDAGITIAQLMNHTSGIADYTENVDFATAVNSTPSHFWDIDSILYNYVGTPDFTPGNSWDYSNTGYLLLGLIIEQVESKAYHTVLRERIFSQLPMNHAWLADYEQHEGVHVGTYVPGQGYLDVDFVSLMTAAWAAGGVICTPANLARWAHRLYGGTFLPDSSLAKMKDGGGLTSYGYGTLNYSVSGHQYFGHGGATLQHTDMAYSVDGDYSVSVHSILNGTATEVTIVRNAIFAVLEDAIPAQAGNVSAIEKVEVENGLQVYPNPCDNMASLHLVAAAPQQQLARVVALNGAIVREFAVPAHAVSMRIDVSELPAGVYLVTCGNQVARLCVQ